MILRFKKVSILILVLLGFFYSIHVHAASKPEIVGKTAITIDVSTGEMIYTKDIDKQMYPASTTKLMTALLLAENKKQEDIFTYSKYAKAQEPFTIDFNVKTLAVNDRINASEAMDAMLLCSANDIAYMIGENVGNGSYQSFIDLMNKKATSLKLKNTHFVSSNGLHDPNHYSSAYDLSVIARQAYKYPWIMNTLIKKEGTINSKNGVVANFKNKDKLLTENGCIGGKTGYTTEAGRCLVSYFEINGRKIVGVVLKSDYDKDDTTVFKDMMKIINWSYSAEREPLLRKDKELKTVTSSYHLLPFKLGPKKTVKISLSIKSDVNRYVSSDNYDVKYSTNSINPWKLSKNTSVGNVIVTSRETSKNYPLYPSVSKHDLLNSNRSFYIEFSIVSFMLLIIIIVFFNKKKNKKYKHKYRRKRKYKRKSR